MKEVRLSLNHHMAPVCECQDSIVRIACALKWDGQLGLIFRCDRCKELAFLPWDWREPPIGQGLPEFQPSTTHLN